MLNLIQYCYHRASIKSQIPRASFHIPQRNSLYLKPQLDQTHQSPGTRKTRDQIHKSPSVRKTREQFHQSPSVRKTREQFHQSPNLRKTHEQFHQSPAVRKTRVAVSQPTTISNSPFVKKVQNLQGLFIFPIVIVIVIRDEETNHLQNC